MSERLSASLRSAARRAAYVLCVVVVLVAVANSLVLLNSAVRTFFDRGGPDDRHKYPNYRDVPWSATHFVEFHELQTEYRSFVGWRRKGFTGTTINVDPTYGFRRSLGQSLDKSVYFLGGSTTWGTGASDVTTIASLFHAATSRQVLNLGEAGYTSRQSLDTLMNMLSYGYRPSAVVSYEGANDVRVHCLKEIRRIPAHYYENQFNADLLLRSAFERGRALATHFFMFVPERIHHKLYSAKGSDRDFDCHADAIKSRRVAQNLVDNWKFMQSTAQSRGVAFYAVLQPTVFSAKSRTDHLPPADFEWGLEYQTVYPLIRQLAEEQCRQGQCGVFVDLSALDFKDAYVFIDFCHLSPNGNERVAWALAETVHAR
jgi:hypothetical protein